MDIQQKQRYLRENILEKEYDAEQFMDFCETTRGSINIQTWTLQELKEIVQKFISTNSKTIQLNPFDYQAASRVAQPLEAFDWDNAFQPPQQPQPVNFNLNTFDMDFLETMGMKTGPSKKLEKKVEQVTIKSLTTDPKAILAKLNNKDGQFISAYNAAALTNREKGKVAEKAKEPKLQREKEVSPTHPKTQKTPQTQPESILVMNIKENVVIDENFKTTVKCRSFSNKPKLDGNYEVTVTGHQVINPNIFVPNYVLYTISTAPLAKEVKRRLKDFQLLRALLKKIFPSTQIPHLQRCSRLSQTEPNVIKKQKLFIESFLNSLMMNPAIRCKIIDDFLLCESLDSLKKILHDFQKLDKPKSIEELYTPQGKVDLEYSAQSKRFVTQQELYFDYLQPNLSKLKDLYDQLLLSFANSVTIMQQISTLYDNLRDSTHNVNYSLPENRRALSLETALDKISDLHKHWALSIKTQAQVVEIEVRHLYRFEVDNLETIRQICKYSDNMVEAYAKRTDKDQAARDTYEFNKKLNDYKTGVDVPSKNTTVLKYQAAYFLEHTVTEIERYLTELSDKLLKKFDLFSGLQLNITRDLQSKWKQFSIFAQE